MSARKTVLASILSVSRNPFRIQSLKSTHLTKRDTKLEGSSRGKKVATILIKDVFLRLRTLIEGLIEELMKRVKHCRRRENIYTDTAERVVVIETKYYIEI